jgi:hypothetical protein
MSASTSLSTQAPMIPMNTVASKTKATENTEINTNQPHSLDTGAQQDILHQSHPESGTHLVHTASIQKKAKSFTLRKVFIFSTIGVGSLAGFTYLLKKPNKFLERFTKLPSIKHLKDQLFSIKNTIVEKSLSIANNLSSETSKNTSDKVTSHTKPNDPSKGHNSENIPNSQASNTVSTQSDSDIKSENITSKKSSSWGRVGALGLGGVALTTLYKFFRRSGSKPSHSPKPERPTSPTLTDPRETAFMDRQDQLNREMNPWRTN